MENEIMETVVENVGGNNNFGKGLIAGVAIPVVIGGLIKAGQVISKRIKAKNTKNEEDPNYDEEIKSVDDEFPVNSKTSKKK